MIAIDEKKVETLVSLYKKDITAQSKSIEARLKNRLDKTTVKYQQDYIKALINKGKQLITANQSEIATFKTEFDDIKPITNSKAHKKFKNQILSDLGYTALRSHFYPKYFEKLGIKSCVYCNSQLCVTVEDVNGQLVARYQVDHFIPKNHYPCLSIALYNLYPVCASCNNKKGIKNIQFDLYAEKSRTKKSNFIFKIRDKDKTVAKYLSDRNPDAIKILFNEPKVTAGYHKLNELFSIKGIYNTQVDIVEELILKRHIYDRSFRNTLEANYPTLFPKGDKIIDRLLLGNYSEEDEIHSRPMAKFMLDIARQLDLI